MTRFEFAWQGRRYSGWLKQLASPGLVSYGPALVLELQVVATPVPPVQLLGAAPALAFVKT